MRDTLLHAELIEHLQESELDRLEAIGKEHQLKSGEYLFRLGDEAESLFVVLKGKIDLCFPLSVEGSMTDLKTESALPGDTVGWSSLVGTRRFTQSARAAEDSEVIAFARSDLFQLFEESPQSGCAVLRKLCEIIARRLMNLQAVLARSLQRAVTNGLGPEGLFDPRLPSSGPAE